MLVHWSGAGHGIDVGLGQAHESASKEALAITPPGLPRLAHRAIWWWGPLGKVSPAAPGAAGQGDSWRQLPRMKNSSGTDLWRDTAPTVRRFQLPRMKNSSGTSPPVRRHRQLSLVSTSPDEELIRNPQIPGILGANLRGVSTSPDEELIRNSMGQVESRESLRSFNFPG